jgi:oligopeptide transport system ATP-binding protein
MTVQEILKEPLTIHKVGDSRSEINERITDLLKKVGLGPDHRNRYPHQFSGGRRQRIGIARALILNPKLIVADESVSALDVSVQGQVLNLLIDLQKTFDLTYLFIAHDLSVIEHISDRVAVMYLGKIAELASSDTLYQNPGHPYTEALLSAVPMPDPEYQRKRIILEGSIPSPVNPPPGCRFHTRCSYTQQMGRKKKCSVQEPLLRQIGENHWVACHFSEELVLAGVEAPGANNQDD